MRRDWIVIGACLSALLLACGDDSASPSADSQTHWLSACTDDAQCGGLSCICGVCVEPCASDGSCAVPGRTTACTVVDAPAPMALCGGAAPMPLCLEPCSGDAVCGGGRCLGACVPAPDTGGGGTSGGGSGTGGMSGGDGDGDATTGDGDGDTTTGGGDGDGTGSGSGDGDGTGSGDGDGTGSGLFWFSTCGDPVCGPPTTPPPGSACTTQVEGEACSSEGESCETGSCGSRLLCTTSDPKAGPGGCPISRARFKQDIAYVGEAERRAYAEQLLSLPLATYRYRAAPDARTHLGFILEDVEPTSTAAVDGARDRVDLYGYTSLAVAAIQEQSQQIEDLQRELERLRREVAELERQCH